MRERIDYNAKIGMFNDLYYVEKREGNYALIHRYDHGHVKAGAEVSPNCRSVTINYKTYSKARIIAVLLEGKISDEPITGGKYDSNGCKLGRQHHKEYYKRNKDAILKSRHEYYKRNKEAIYEQHKEYCKRNKDAISEWHKEYCEQNKEAISEWHKEYYKRNKEAISEQKKEYYKRNKEAISERKKEYYKRKKEKKD